jgi:hypothetical protein
VTAPRLTEGMRVATPRGEGTITGFEREEDWTFGRPRVFAWVLVALTDGRDRRGRPRIARLSPPEVEPLAA